MFLLVFSGITHCAMVVLSLVLSLLARFFFRSEKDAIVLDISDPKNIQSDTEDAVAILETGNGNAENWDVLPPPTVDIARENGENVFQPYSSEDTHPLKV